MRNKAQGFTLIELMIVVVIIGILASIAYPAYIQNTQATKRAAAQADLMEIASFMERFFTENNTYVGATVPTGITSDDYDYSLDPAPTAIAYVLEAEPQGAQTADKCGTMTLSQTGATTPAAGNCWR